jgi:hypothetical protein
MNRARPTFRPLPQYVGWKDMRWGMRYIDAADPFAQHCIEPALATPGAAVEERPLIALPAP